MLTTGAVFHSVIPGATQDQINRFGALHGTTGRTHTDPEYAKTSVFGGVIVQGALVMAPIFDICRVVLGAPIDARMDVETKFVSFTRPGEAISVKIEVVSATPERVELSYSCANPAAKVVQVGTVAWPSLNNDHQQA